MDPDLKRPRAQWCLDFMTCCSLIWLGAGDKAECQIQISGQTWILYFSYQTSSCFGKVTLSPAHAMWRTPVICWKGGWSCCEKLPVPEPAYESLFLTRAAADGFVCWERRTAETCLDSSTGKKKKMKRKAVRSRLQLYTSLCCHDGWIQCKVETRAQQQQALRINWENNITVALSTTACFTKCPSHCLGIHSSTSFIEKHGGRHFFQKSEYPWLNWQKICVWQTAWSAKY